MPDAAQLLVAYDTQLRGRAPERLPEGAYVDRDGPLVRVLGRDHGGFIGYRDLDGLDGAELDELIGRQVRDFAERGERFEWKLHGHDLPADLSLRLLAAGFVPDEQETVLIAAVAAVAARPSLPEGLKLREAVERADFDRIVELEEAIWHAEHSWLGASLEAERAADPEGMTIIVVEAEAEAEGEAELVCAAWVRFEQGTDFATLWGGGTLSSWRRRGIYRATVAYRASLAARRGYRFVEVDASENSRPILERLGFVAVTTTTPYIWSPPSEA